jgi:phosphoserine phosphatase RsbU/P
MKILIAEDDYTSRAMLKAVLEKAGHSVVEAVDGAEAWEILKNPDAPKMAILDWMMPKINGLDLVRRAREIPSKLPPCLIMLTTKDEKADIIAALNAGANDFLAKPFDAGELRARIDAGSRMIELQEALNEKIEELEQALEQIKTLSGILPICACCHKIRNDAGYWQQVDTYLRDHTEAQFSHGLCPKCQKDLYPDYF